MGKARSKRAKRDRWASAKGRRLRLERLEPRLVLSTTPQAIDINPSGSANPSPLVLMGGFAYFSADDGTHGVELWKTDGTSQGTTLVKDINSGSGASSPTGLTVVGNTLFFAADDGTDGVELWKSDGTADGTVMVKDINPGSTGSTPNASSPTSLTAVGNTLFFAADDGTDGVELWKSDGTADGTVMVKDINSGSTGSSPTNLTAVGSTLFFSADDGTDGTELWKSDGTGDGTVMVKDINPGSTSSTPNSSNPANLTDVNGTLFFAADDGTDGTELWASDGTADGTVLVQDIASGSASSSPQSLTVVGSTLFFVANDGLHGEELWKSEGAGSGAVLVKDINPGSGGNLGYYPAFADVNGTLFFSADDGTHGRELWKSDGTEAGTVMVKDINTGTNSSNGKPRSSYPFYFKNISGTLYFSAYTVASGRELWQSDGTAEGTVLVSDTVSGNYGVYPYNIESVNGQLMFSGDSNSQRELWTTGAVQTQPQSGSAQLSIYVNGQQVAIPANVGVYNDGTSADVHTTDGSGALTINSLGATLGSFFDVWRTNAGQAGNNSSAGLSATQLMGNAADTTNTVQMFVNGQISTDFQNYVLKDGDHVVLVYGSDPVVSLNTNFGSIVLDLYQGQTPITVDNFLTYINLGDYANTFFHRSVSNFVIQGGGFTTSSTTFTSTSQFSSIKTLAPIQNEPGISNTRGTIAMAKLSGDPNSATSQFFFNLADNSFLDSTANNAFTVFGQVLDMSAVDNIANLPINTSNASPFNTLPLDANNQLAVVQSITGQGNLTGVEFQDANGNGVQDSGEQGIAGAVVYIDANGNGVLDSGEISTTTDASGHFLLQAVPGTYNVRTEVAPGLLLTAGVSGNPATVKIGQTTSSLNFGVAPPAAPAGVDLQASADSGAASDDDLTNFNNSSAGLALVFQVSGVADGALVRVYSDGTLIGSATASGGNALVTTDGTTLLADGTHAITATQSVGGTESGASSALNVTIDTTPPAQITDTPPAAAPHDQLYTFDANSPEEGQTGFAYALSGAPSGMTIDAQTGVVNWTPTLEQTGPQTFSIQLTDAAGNSTSQPFQVTVLGVIPAVPDVYSMDEETTLTLAADAGVLANDGDAGSGTLTASVVSQPSNGTLTLNADGSLTYTPNAGFVGVDSFTYQATNGTDTSNVAPVQITVNAVNHPPTAVDDTYTLSENGTLTLDASHGVLANDSDPEGDPLTAALSGQASHGTATLNADGSLTYAPNAAFVGTDSFTYTVSDGVNDPVSATVTLTVQAVPPTAADDVFSVLSNGAAETLDVLANDASPSGGIDNLTIISVTQGASGGTVAVSGGAVSYTAPAGYVGSDSFTYTIQDANGLTATGNVNVTVSGATGSISGFVFIDTNGDGSRSSAEAGVPGALVTLSGSDVSGRQVLRTMLSADDGSYTFSNLPAGTYQLVEEQPHALRDGQDSSPVSGAVVGNDVISNLVLGSGASLQENDFGEAGLRPQYVSVVWFFASSSSWQNLLRDTIASGEQSGGNAGLADAIRSGVTNMTGNDSAPIASSDGYAVAAGGALNVPASSGVLGNDSDPNGDSLTAALVSDVSNGTLTLNTDGSFAYTPNAGFTGSDSFTYQASDGQLESNIATVTITVSAPANTAPVATDDAYSTSTDVSTLTVDAAGGVLANDTDAESNPLTAQLVSTTSNGTLTLSADGSFTYTPNASFSGSDSFTYQASDGQLASNTATVTIAVMGPPTAAADSYTVNEDTPLNVDAASGVLANDNDPDGDNLTAVLGTDAANGSLTLNSDGSFQYTPNSNFNGSDSFTYVANDGTSNSAETTVAITINPVNDPPVAVDDTYQVAQDNVLTVDAASGVLANDTDVEGDSLTASLVSGPSNGTLALNPDGSFTYTPTGGFSGTDSFTYVANDGQADSTPATVAINVTSNSQAEGEPSSFANQVDQVFSQDQNWLLPDQIG